MPTNNTKQAAWISIGSLFSFGFSIVSSMILSRYFDKGDYGTYRQVMYVYHTLLTVFTLGLPKTYSYFLPRVNANEAKDLINKITGLFFILGAVFSLTLFVGSPVISHILKNPDLTVALRYFSLVPFLMLPTMGLEGILATYQKTKFLALYTIVTRVLMLLCVAIPVMLFDLDYIGAIKGFVIASFFAFLLAMFLKSYPVRKYKKDKTLITYKEIFQFSLPLLYASMWGVLMNSSDQFFISRHFGTEVFAEYSNGSMELPFIGMVVAACSTVLSPIFSRLAHEKVDLKTHAFPLWKSVFEKTAKLIYPLIVFCWVFADLIMVFLYGGKYETSQIYFRIKIFTYVFSLVVYGPFLINTGKVKFYANVTALFAIVIWPLEYFSVILTNSPYSVSVVSVICHIARVMVSLYAVSRMFDVRLYQLFPIRLTALIIIPSVLFLFFEKYLIVKYLTVSPLISLIIGLLLYLVFYLIYAKLVRIDYVSLIKPLLSKK